MTFLDTVIELWNDKNWKHKSFDAEMLNWIQLLLGTVDVSVDKAVSYVKEFVNQLSHPVCAQYQKQIVDKVRLFIVNSIILIIIFFVVNRECQESAFSFEHFKVLQIIQNVLHLACNSMS